jgi:GT2 family glycosyltransferase
MELPPGHEQLAIIVVNFGSSSLLRTNLSATAAQLPRARVVVVDNWSTAAERTAVQALCLERGWTCVAMADNAGFGGGNNAGVARARELGATWFLLVNPDVVLDGPPVDHLLATAVRETPAMVAPRILRPDGSVWSVGTDLYLDDGRMRSVARRAELSGRREFWLSGACLLLDAELWDACGGFGDEYFLYWEDVELSRRVVQAGGRLVLDEDAEAVHAEGGTQGDGLRSGGTAKSSTYYYYNTRNRLVFAARNLDEHDLRSWMRTAVPAARHILLQGGRRQFLKPWSPMSAAFRGTRDGLARAREALAAPDDVTDA